MPSRNGVHPGVKILKLGGQRFVARFADPVDGIQKQVSLAAINITTEDDRLSWAKQKSAEIMEARRSASLGCSVQALPKNLRIKEEGDAKPDVASRPMSVQPQHGIAASDDLIGAKFMASAEGSAPWSRRTGIVTGRITDTVFLIEMDDETHTRRLVNLAEMMSWTFRL